MPLDSAKVRGSEVRRWNRWQRKPRRKPYPTLFPRTKRRRLCEFRPPRGPNPDPLDFAHAHVIVAPVIQARCFRVRVASHTLRYPDTAATQWTASPARAPLPEDSHGVPGIEDRDAKTGEILHIPCHDGEIVFQSRRGNEAVHNLEQPSLHLTLSGQHAPAFGNWLVHRQDSAFEPRPQCLIEPLLQ